MKFNDTKISSNSLDGKKYSKRDPEGEMRPASIQDQLASPLARIEDGQDPYTDM